MRIAYNEISSLVLAALELRGLSGRVGLQPIDHPRPWGITCNACFTLGAQYAAGEIKTASAGLDKKTAKDVAGRLAREAGLRLAQEVAAELEACRAAGKLTQYISRVEAEGAYLNFYYDTSEMARLLISVAGMKDHTPDNPNDNYGSGTIPAAQRKQIMVEYAQPNTHKDFHVGHLRNASIGQAIANLLEFSGHTVYKATYLGDVGAHVAKAFLGYELFNQDGFLDRLNELFSLAEAHGTPVPSFLSRRAVVAGLLASGEGEIAAIPLDIWSQLYAWGNGLISLSEELSKTSALGSDADLDPQAFHTECTTFIKEWLKKWEQGDPIARDQWSDSRDACLSSFSLIFRELLVDFHPDCWFYESTVDDTHLGQKTAAELKERGIAVVDETDEYKGALYVDFAAQADAVQNIDSSRGGRQTAFSDAIDGNSETQTDAGKGGLATASTGDGEAGTGTEACATEEPVFSDVEKKRIRQLGKMTILRSNGTSLYQTKELGLAKHKFDWVKQQTGRDLDESLYVVGAEQKLYFEQVFAILRLWGFPNADKCRHIAYELVVLPEGKMSSREGTVVSYRELRDAAVAQAQHIIREKGLITDEAQIADTAKAIAIAAIKYTMLQVSGNQQIVFDFVQALSFDGRSAPYLQYAYARAGKLVASSGAAVSAATNAAGSGETPVLPALHESEIALARLLSQFPETCESAALRYEPAVLCNYLYACADAFSAFYRDCRVAGAPEPQRTFRQGLVHAFRNVLRTGFAILALPLPETM